MTKLDVSSSKCSTRTRRLILYYITNTLAQLYIRSIITELQGADQCNQWSKHSLRGEKEQYYDSQHTIIKRCGLVCSLEYALGYFVRVKANLHSRFSNGAFFPADFLAKGFSVWTLLFG